MTNSCLLNAIPLNTLPEISPRLISKLARFGLENLQDLLLYLPARYEDRTKLYAINEALPGMTVTVQGEVLSSNISFYRKRILTCYLRDNSGILTLRFFHFNAAIKNSLSPGQSVTVYGQIRRGQLGGEIIHPEYRIISKHGQATLATGLTPVYPTISGIKQTTLRSVIDRALKLLDSIPIPELLPLELSSNLISLSDALRRVHHPPPEISLDDVTHGYYPALRRLILEELLAHNLSMIAIRIGIQKDRAFPLRTNNIISHRFLSALPFSLTKAQQRVVTEITRDLARDVPMMRLVQGDVGSGKTLVAAVAALCAISDNRQVALMAPTELLAEQHAKNFRDWFEPLGIEVGWLTSKRKGKVHQIQKEAISNGRISMVVGTHAIFQEQIHFSGLALIIIDEQHRFGVHQRLALWEKGVQKGFYPHQLILTATPIPRTLMMTIYADLDASVIDELPPGRIPVTTVVIPGIRRTEIICRVRQACLKEQRQVYWVCTLIGESDVLEAQAAEVTCKELQRALPELQIGLVHGRMKMPERQRSMQAFKTGDIQLLVSTTLIEVGVDVPNASLMIIENPERLGLAQLHQLRGRVGRGAMASHCILLYKSPLSKAARTRLQILRHSNDGFFIAQRDLEIRGPGELLGARQTGNAAFRVADLLRDQVIILEVQHLTKYIHRYHPHLACALIQRWMPERIRYTFA